MPLLARNQYSRFKIDLTTRAIRLQPKCIQIYALKIEKKEEGRGRGGWRKRESGENQ